MIMPAHVIYSGADPVHPATTSRVLLEDVLRRELGFEGVVVSDDLKMGAVRDAGGAVDVAVEALMAGSDLLLCCHDEELQEEIRVALADAARRQRSVERRLEQAASRSVALRRRFVPSPVLPERLDGALSGPEIDEIVLALDGGIENERHG
jgi:beta-N-acetylhexosaminidase